MSSKDKTINAATELFHEQGFRDTSVDKIIEACDISKSNFYYHFESKEALGFAVLEKWVEGFNRNILHKALRDYTINPTARIEKLFATFIKLSERRGGRLGCPFGNLSLEMSDVHEGFRMRLVQFFDEWAQDMEECLEEGKREGIWSKNMESHDMAHFIIAATEGAILLTKTYRQPAQLKRNLEMISNLLRSYEINPWEKIDGPKKTT